VVSLSYLSQLRPNSILFLSLAVCNSLHLSFLSIFSLNLWYSPLFWCLTLALICSVAWQEHSFLEVSLLYRNGKPLWLGGWVSGHAIVALQWRLAHLLTLNDEPLCLLFSIPDYPWIWVCWSWQQESTMFGSSGLF